jgi:hypothetical protein
MVKKLLWVLCVALMAQSAVLADYEWNGGASGSWSNPANWIDTGTGLAPAFAPGMGSGNVVAGFRTQAADWTNVTVRPSDTGTIYGYSWADEATVRQAIREADSWYNWTAQSVSINAGDTVNLYRFRGANYGHFTNGTVNVYGTLAISNNFQVGRSQYASTAINQYAGSAVTGGNLELGYKAYRSTYTVYGGTLSVTTLTMPTPDSGYAMPLYIGSERTADDDLCAGITESALTISGGSVIVGSGGLVFNAASYPSPRIVIYAGELKILGDKQTQIQGLIDTGKITGDGPISYSFDGAYTVVIPEPATMMMLALGGLCLFRKRK